MWLCFPHLTKVTLVLNVALSSKFVVEKAGLVRDSAQSFWLVIFYPKEND